MCQVTVLTLARDSKKSPFTEEIHGTPFFPKMFPIWFVSMIKSCFSNSYKSTIFPKDNLMTMESAQAFL